MSRPVYGLCVALCGGLLSFVGLVFSGPHFPSGEQWQGYAFGWAFFGVPAMVLGGVASAFLAPRYNRQPSTALRTRFFAANVLGVAFLGHLLLLVLLLWP